MGMGSDGEVHNSVSEECENNDRIDNPSSLWFIQWCYFYAPNMNTIYQKYQERGGRPVFRTQ